MGQHRSEPPTHLLIRCALVIPTATCVLEYLVDSNFQVQLREGFFAGRGCQAVRSLPGGIQVGRLHVVGKFRVQGLPANLQAWKDGGRKAFAVD